MEFEPIAIVGRGCVLPGALSPEELWRVVIQGDNTLTPPEPRDWGHATVGGLTDPADPALTRMMSNRGGFVRHFRERFDATGFLIPSETILTLDSLFQWLLYAGREALRSAGYEANRSSVRHGAIIGNLSYPTRALVDFAERVWRNADDSSADARNRFNSGLPAHILSQALGLGAGSYALDAACASSLYAIKLACDWLHDRRADLMLAGGVNAADGFIIHGGFNVLQAISPTGRSRPFHRKADGLVPSEGAALVALKRLKDAEAAGDRILGVITGIGLSNDGRAQGFLVPSESAQARAMRSAYAMAGVRPSDISLVECHATGTLVGDAAEIRSMSQIFRGTGDLPIGSLKSNLGHLITAAGAAGLLKVLAAMEAGVRPATLHTDDPIDAFAGTPFRLLHEAEPWKCEGPLRAAVSSFGFGGNNAHLVLEQWSPRVRRLPAAPVQEPVDVAIVGIGVIAGDCQGLEKFTERLVTGQSFLPGARADTIELDLSRLRFPPNDLKHALPQQLLILEAALQISDDVAKLPDETTGVFIGMQCDAEGARIAVRCRLPDGSPREAYDGISPPLTPAGVIGAMPNIVANRLHSCFDLKGPGFAVSAEELSGITALEIGVRSLRTGELDAALVGAVDLSCEPVHETAARALFPQTRQFPADAAVIMVLKRLPDARRDKNTIYAVLPSETPSRTNLRLDLGLESPSSLTALGHAHAASGLLHVTAAAIACYQRTVPVPGRPAMPWLPEEKERVASVSVDSFSGQSSCTWLRPAAGSRPVPALPVPKLSVYTAESRDALYQALCNDAEKEGGSLRLAIVSRDAATFARQREQAISALRAHRGAPQQLCELADGIYLGEVPVSGDLAFVFTGPAGAYPQMGRDLLLGIPELADGIADRFTHMQQGAGWIFAPGSDAGAAEPDPGPSEKLWGASFLSQIHAELTRGLLGLKPQAVLGFCSGETNALFALGAWQDMDRLHQDIEAGGVFAHELGGDFAAVARSWKQGGGIAWRSWRIFAPVNEVRRALASETKAHLTIVSAPGDVVIAGDADACKRVIDAVGSRRAQALGYNVVMHCPEAEAVADVWHRLHHRPTSAPAGVRFYTHATCSHYEPTADRVADMLTRQAMTPVDFPRLIENAWGDGVRIFIEHGPLSGCSRWIQQILGPREHLSLALDSYGTSSLFQAADTVARLAAAGVPVNYKAFVERLGCDSHRSSKKIAAIPARFPAHWDPPRIPAEEAVQEMAPAPWLPPVSEEMVASTSRGSPTLNQITAHQEKVAALHQEFLRQQTEVQHQFVQLMQKLQKNFLDAYPGGALNKAVVTSDTVPASGLTLPLIKGESRREARARQGEALEEAAGGRSHALSNAPPPRGPSFSRDELKIHASGKISTLFGPGFAPQDGFQVQVRLPEEPLLLVDRVTGIDAEPGSMRLGTLWTETDVRWDSWYLHGGRMPAGIMVEAGQADLMLISWLGVDSLNRGERAYRLLGCEGTYHGGLPKPGDTLCYDIHVDSYARQGDVLLFFFHYDCRINGELRLSVRNGHAGFFTAQELAESQGVLWDPHEIQPREDARLDPPLRCTERRQFSEEHIRAFSEGRVLECFGPGFERAEAHTRTPRIMSGQMCLLGEVESFVPGGGPWGRGYLKCVSKLSTDDWFFKGHFKNDPCMPGTLMFQACLQAMEFYLTALGYTLDRDGWRFEPVTDETYTLRCRGQAVPASRELVYEIFVEEISAGPCPTMFADMLCTVDGLKAFHGRRIGLKLVPDWPLESDRKLQKSVANYSEPRPAAVVDGFVYGFPSLLACAWGRPSRAFGGMYEIFDGPRRVARLPGPPYHFMSRLCEINGPRGGMREGMVIEAEYDIPRDAWYFRENAANVMPFCVLLESALQPCGWLASYAGCTLTSDQDLQFRNLDGTATVFREIRPDAGTLRTRTKLKSISQAAGTILVSFDVEIVAGDQRVANVDTTFGFFTSAALANQVGLPSPQEAQSGPDAAGMVQIDLKAQPSKYFHGTLRLPEPMLLMIDRVTGYWPEGGKEGLGRVRAEQNVDPSAWYFKAHFFQDPVQPGTLGIEGMLQLLQFMMLHQELGRDIPNPHFAPIALEQVLNWKYRGQVLPENRAVAIELELTEVVREEQSVLARAEAWLSVDGLRIYQANLGMRIAAGVPPSGPQRMPIDANAIRSYWRPVLGIDHCTLTEDLYMALIQKYVRHVFIEDPEALAGIRGRSALFLANHQLAIETPLLLILASFISRTEVSALAKAEHQASWMGELMARTFSYPGMRQMQNIIYLNRTDQRSAMTTLESLKRDVFSHGRSLIVHVEGTRSLSCRVPVRTISALFLDMAVELDLPIVPVRFAGGLPVSEAAARLEFPLEDGSQDYYFGTPVLPDVLRRAPYAKRKEIVIDAINNLGPSSGAEQPNPPDPEFGAAVDEWRRTTQTTVEYATLFTALQRLRDPGPQALALLAAASGGHLSVPDDEYGMWLQDLAERLLGAFI